MSPRYLLLLVACTLFMTSATTANEMKAKLKEALEAGQEDRFNAIFGEDKASLAEAARLKDLSGQTAVHTACYNDDEQTLRVLREGKGDLSLTDDAGNNCFHLLTQAGHETLMMSLLVDENDLFLIAKNKKLMTPLMLAAGKGLDEVVSLLSRPNLSDKDRVNVHSSPNDWLTMGPTALFYAAANGNLSTVEILLKNGATSNLKDENGETALTSACKNGHEKVAAVLLEHLSSSAVKSKTEVSFASQSLACIKDLAIDEKKINLDGGAIALGHPLGATGARITGKAADLLRRENKKYALATQCIGLGMGIATIIESVE